MSGDQPKQFWYDGSTGTYLLGHLRRLAFLWIHDIFSLLFMRPAMPMAMTGEQQSGVRTVAGAIALIEFGRKEMNILRL